MSNPSYGQGSDPTATSGSSAGAVPEPYATDQPVPSEPYMDVPSQPADVSYGTVEESTGGSGGSRLSAAKDTAKGEASAMKDTAMGAGRSVAATARDQAVSVKDQATTQAKSLLGTVTDEVRNQGRNQQSRLAGAVHSWSKELGTMASKSEEGGPLSDLMQQASRKGGEVAHWLENKEPSDLLEEVRSFARRRPGTFLGLSALAGVVVGRLGRSVAAATTSLDTKDDMSQPSYEGSELSSTPPSYATTVPDTGYATGYDTGYAGTGTTGYTAGSTLGDEAGPSMGGYATGGMPESGPTYPSDEGLQPPYRGQDDLNR